MTTTRTITATNAHGLFTADAEVLDRAIAATAFRSLDLLRHQAAGHCGHPVADFFGMEAPGIMPTAFDDLNRIEVLIAWIDSGNHTF